MMRTQRIPEWGIVVLVVAGLVCGTARGDLSQPVPADEVLLFEDDGTSYNPTTGAFNAWSFNSPGDWDVAVKTNQVAAFPDYMGTDAATEMLNTLGPNNDLIIADVFENGTVSMTSPAFAGITPTNGDQLPFMFFVQEAATGLPSLERATYLFDAFRLTAKDLTTTEPLPPPGQRIIRIKMWSTMHVIRRQENTTGALLDHADALGELRAAGITDLPFVTTNTVEFFAMPDVEVSFDLSLDDLNQISPEWISTMRLREIPEPASLTLLAAGAGLLARRLRVGLRDRSST